MKSIKHVKKQVFIVAICLLLFAATGYTQAESNLYGVIVGVSKYKKSENNLNYAHKDAIDMYDLLRLRSDVSRLVLLTDELATQANIVKTAEKLFSQARPEDIVIFFFAGHGDTGMFWAHDRELWFTDLRTVFRNTKANRKVIFADSCRSGTLRTPGRAARSNGNADLGDNVLLFLSSRSDQKSFENSDTKSGLFAWFLMAGLRGGADENRDRLITARELFDFVNPGVRKESGGSQVPVMWGNFDGDMVILDWR